MSTGSESPRRPLQTPPPTGTPQGQPLAREAAGLEHSHGRRHGVLPGDLSLGSTSSPTPLTSVWLSLTLSLPANGVTSGGRTGSSVLCPHLLVSWFSRLYCYWRRSWQNPRVKPRTLLSREAHGLWEETGATVPDASLKVGAGQARKGCVRRSFPPFT